MNRNSSNISNNIGNFPNNYSSIFSNVSNMSGMNCNFSGNIMPNNSNYNMKYKMEGTEKSSNKINQNLNKSQSVENEEEEEEENDIFQEMDENNGIKFTGKKSNNIIKQETGNDMPSDIYNIEHDMDLGKGNLYRGVNMNPMAGNSSSNLNLMSGQNNNNIERVMSALPVRKDIVQENSNQYYDDI